MLAHRMPGILPPLSEAEALEVATVASIGNGFDPARWGRRPFRAPHHTASGVALVGGGSQPKPGEITLAHHGVLFLDELPERSEEHTSELQSLMRISYAVFCLKNKHTTHLLLTMTEK